VSARTLAWVRRQTPSLVIGLLISAIILLIPPLTTGGAQGEALMSATCRPIECPAPGSRLSFGFESHLRWTPPPDAADVALASMVAGTAIGLVAGVRRGPLGIVGALALGVALAVTLGYVLQPQTPITVPEGVKVLDALPDGTMTITITQQPLMGTTWEEGIFPALLVGPSTVLAHALLVARPARPWPWWRKPRG